MNIAYGVSGEGLGHVFEAIEILEILRREGHVVKVVTFGDRACNHLAEFRPVRIEGLSLCVNSKGFSILLSIFKNLRCIPFLLKNWKLFRNDILAFKPHVFITSYEPFTTFASHLLHKPLISMDNQNELLYIKYERGSSLLHFKLAQWFTRIITYGASYYIIKSHRKLTTARKNVYFVSPFIQNKIRDLLPIVGEYILVYLTKPNLNLIRVLKLIPQTFVVYCNDQVGCDGNIIYRASGPSYLPDLSGCKAIIGTTGFSLINDAIYLKKPYFGVPIRKQPEQIHNAHFLRQSGIGEFSLDVTSHEIERFLSDLDAYRIRLSLYQMNCEQQKQTLLKLLNECSRMNT